MFLSWQIWWDFAGSGSTGCVGQISFQNENLREQRLPCTCFLGILSPEQGGGSSSSTPEWMDPKGRCGGSSRTLGVRTMDTSAVSSSVPSQDFFQEFRILLFPKEHLHFQCRVLGFFPEFSWSNPTEHLNRAKFPGEVNSPHPINFFALSKVFLWKGSLFLRNLSSSGKMPPKMGRGGKCF